MKGLIVRIHLPLIGCLLASHVALAASRNEPVKAIASPKNIDTEQVQLGNQLFKTACTSCHSPKLANNSKNVPLQNTVYNARFFHNGRARNIAEVLDDHMADPSVFNSNWDDFLASLNTHDTPLTQAQYKHAISEYLRTLTTPSAFDAYLLGDEKAITPEAKKGYEIFKELGCATCHQGANLGGNLYQKMDVYASYFSAKEQPNAQDLGRYAITKEEHDKFVYRVPGLRNIALTSPYFHDHSANTLTQALELMATPKLGRDIPKRDYNELIAFLNSLTGTELLQGTE